MKNDVSAWLVLIFLVLCFKDFGPSTDKTTVYFGVCSAKSVGSDECLVTKAGPETVFRAMAQSQVVVSLEAGAVYRLQDCTVLDAKNWTCSQLGFIQSMSKGQYIAPWATMTVRPVSWAYWLLLRARDVPADILLWLKESNALGWAVGLATLIAAIALPSFGFRTLTQKFPWLDAYITGSAVKSNWRAEPGRALASAFVALALVVTGFAVLAAGATVYEVLPKGWH